MSQTEKASRLLSYILRHKPETFNISLDKEGWAMVDQIVTNTTMHTISLTPELIYKVVCEDEKGRYELSPDRDEVRAVQGHSTKLVDICYSAEVPPAVLYHGTAIHNLDSIKQHGLTNGNRQYVHLSEDTDTANAVGKRHGDPVVIAIDCKKMTDAGHLIYKAPNGVWLAWSVPSEFLLYSVAVNGN